MLLLNDEQARRQADGIWTSNKVLFGYLCYLLQLLGFLLLLARSAAENSCGLLFYFLWWCRSRLLFLTDLWNNLVISILRYAIRRKQMLTMGLLLWHLTRVATNPLLIIIIFIITNNIRVSTRRGSLSLLTHERILLQLATQGHQLVLTGTTSSTSTVLVLLIHTMINRLIKLRRYLRLEELIRRCCNHWLLLELLLVIMEVLLRPRQLLLKVVVNLMLLGWASSHTSIIQHVNVNRGSSASIRTSKTATDTISTTHKNLTLGSGVRVSRSLCRMRQSSRRRPLMMGLHLQHLENLTCSDGHGLLLCTNGSRLKNSSCSSMIGRIDHLYLFIFSCFFYNMR